MAANNKTLAPRKCVECGETFICWIDHHICPDCHSLATRGDDPTPEEIAAHCAVFKARYLANMPNNPVLPMYDREPVRILGGFAKADY